LPTELHQLIHDFIGDGSKHDAVALHAFEPSEIKLLANHDTNSSNSRKTLSNRLHFFGVNHGDWNYRNFCLENHSRNSGSATIKPSIGAAGALRVDA
jgi:hypothetical protein